LLVAALLWVAPPLADLIYREPEPFFLIDPGVAPRPEPEEGTRFLLASAAPAALGAAILLAGATGIVRRRASGPAATNRPAWIDLAIVVIQVGVLGFAVASIAAQFDEPIAVPEGLGFAHSVIPFWGWLLGGFAGAVATGLAIGGRGSAPGRSRWPRSAAEEPSAERRRAVDLVFVGIVLLTALWLLPAISTESSIGRGNYLVFSHTPNQFEEYLAVINGRTPLVDFISQYTTLLPLALAPVLWIFGASVTTFTVSMAVLTLTGLIAVYLAFWEVSGHRIAAVVLYVAFLAAALLPFAEQGSSWAYTASLFSAMPARYLGPLLLAWLCVRSINRHRPRRWLVFGGAGLVVLNNFEFGFVCLIATAVGLALATDPETPLRTRARALGIDAAAGLAAALVLVSALVLIRTSELPDLGFLVYFTVLFTREGAGFLPSPVLGLHAVLYLTYAAALILAAVRYVARAENRALTALLAYSGTAGLGTISYYGGRSSSINLVVLFAFWGLAAGTLAWAAFTALQERKAPRIRMVLPAFGIFALIGAMASTAVHFPAPWHQAERISEEEMGGDPGPYTYDREAAIRFVATNSEPGEHVSIFDAFSHRVAERAGVVSTMPFNSPHVILTNGMMDRVVDGLRDDGGRTLFLAPVYPEIQAYLTAHGYAPAAADPASGFTRWQEVAGSAP
jgi:hypothetical protein